MEGRAVCFAAAVVSTQTAASMPPVASTDASDSRNKTVNVFVSGSSLPGGRA